jgi:hypothetical protein
MTVMRVAVENIMPIWPQIEPMVARLVTVQATHDAEDVRRMLMGQLCHLWVQWSDRVQSFAITEFVTYPKGVWLRVWLAATADGEILDNDGYFETISKWRDDNGCRGFEAIGRHGWLRRFPGFRVEGLVIRTGA